MPRIVSVVFDGSDWSGRLNVDYMLPARHTLYVGAEIRRGDADDPLRGLVRLLSRDERSVDVFVGRLRDKIDKRALRHTFIQTRYGVGYKLEAVPK